MATMPFSGTISSADLQSVFGSDSSFSSADYYRGGAFVPSTKEVTGTWTSYMYSSSPGAEYEWAIDTTPGTGRASIRWNGVTETSGLSPGLTEWLAGGYRYQRGSLMGAAAPFQFYELRRRQEGAVAVNGSVPTSGQITSSDWYGAESN